MFKDILNNKSNNNKNILSDTQPKNKITAYNYDTGEKFSSIKSNLVIVKPFTRKVMSGICQDEFTEKR